MVVLLAERSGADMKKVIVGQCVRLFFIIAALPFVIELLNGQGSASLPAAAVIADASEIGLLVAASVAAGLIFERLRVPAGLILGAVLAAAALGLGGMTKGAAPDAILIPANVVLGGLIGIRFADIGAAELKSCFKAGFGGFIVGLAVASAGAALTAWIGGLPLALTLLAFAPGGLEAMIIMAFALGLDPAYVAAHQIVRYVGLVLLMPVVTAFFLGGVHKNVSAARRGSALDDG
ncbi:MAG: AbrB family transcriptional regulator [Rhizobiales bacterium]|nr:AbrB family transcriptional regulator [Hyphomicrobiales bacterium]